jgi:proteasome activator subunit 3 (PA28 gamma)
MAEEQEVPVIGINEKNYELAQMVKPVILALYDTCVLLRNWIILLIPKVEDGNNFGVEVQEQCLAQIKSKSF